MLKNESLHTLMTEVETIVNSQPLTLEKISDPQSLTALYPTKLLTMKSRVTMSPPGSFSDLIRTSEKTVKDAALSFCVLFQMEERTRVHSSTKIKMNYKREEF